MRISKKDFNFMNEMKSETRQDCELAVTKFAEYLSNKNTKGELLYVGLAGDPIGGEYSPLFKNYNIKTLDICEKWNPDIVADITRTSFGDEIWDLIVCVQTIEHIPNIWDFPNEIHRILKPEGYLIVDCPFNYPYHGEPEFGDYWRISKDGMNVLFGSKFQLCGLMDSKSNTSCLYKKI
jgi:SAM-dependent methyltransferase